LILGAWGCGVFQNDPRQVARVFADHLAVCGAAFERIVFAIPRGGRNLSAFQAVFYSSS
jgi:uncharacterized protein (TIGR02452 family)